MQENLTIARPYAQAAFDVAQAAGAVTDWERSLDLLSGIVSDPDMRRVINSPGLSRDRIAELVGAVSASAGLPLAKPVHNFVRVLLDAGRLNLMPEIALGFAAHHANVEKVAEVQVTSAFPLDEATQRRIVQSMQTRLGKEVRLSVTIDSALIGGAKVKVGDVVFDASLRGGLSQLANVFNIK